MQRRLTHLLFLGLILGLSVPSLGAGIEYVSVEVEGRGESLKTAIDDALTQAIGRVNGISIESSSLLKTSEKYEEKNEDSDYYVSQEYQDSISSKTKGQIKEYSVLSKNKENEGKTWVVKVKASIAKYKVSKSAQRKRIAVMPLQARGDCCNMMGLKTNPIFAAEELSRGLSNALVQSRKFTVLDRDYIAERSSEKNILNSGEVPPEELAKLGQELFSDYIMVGTISTATVRETTRKMRTNDLTFKELSGITQFSYRIIDVPTSQIKFSSNASIKISNNEFKNIGIDEGNEPSEVIYGLLNIASGKIGQKILDAIFPILVESVQGKVLVLGQGGESVKRGQRMELILRGEVVKDSYTKESLGRTEEVIGEIEITSVTPKQSYAKIITSSKDDIAALFKPKLLIVRPFDESQDMKKKKEEIKKKRGEKKKEFDEDW